MRAAQPAWYVVQHAVDPPLAVPLSSASAANSFCAALRAKGICSTSYPVLGLDRTSVSLLEQMVGGDIFVKRRAAAQFAKDANIRDVEPIVDAEDPADDNSDDRWIAECPCDEWPEICNACYGRAEYGQSWCDNCLGRWEEREIAAGEARFRQAGLCIQCGTGNAASGSDCCASCSTSETLSTDAVNALLEVEQKGVET